MPAQITSAPVCCLSDIPAAHLSYHSYRYGKFAIGFYRSAAVRQGFNPVFYSLEHTRVVRSIYNGFSELQGSDPWGLENAAGEIEFGLADLEGDIENNISLALADIESEAQSISDTIGSANKALRQFLAFVKPSKIMSSVRSIASANGEHLSPSSLLMMIWQ